MTADQPTFETFKFFDVPVVTQKKRVRLKHIPENQDNAKYITHTFRVVSLHDSRNVKPFACDTPQLVYHYYQTNIACSYLNNPDVETMWVVCLNTRRHITGQYLVSTGTLDTLLCHPREIFRCAIVANAAVIVLIHNHPSGDPQPSEADIRITRDMVKAGQLLKIEVLDHIIIGKRSEICATGYASLRELGYFYPAK